MSTAAGHAHVFRAEHSQPGEIATYWTKCECGLRQRVRRIRGRIYEVRWQLPRGQDWIDPVALLKFRAAALLCPRCHGERSGCPRCNDVGIVAP